MFLHFSTTFPIPLIGTAYARAVLKAKIERAEEAIARGEIVSHEEVVRRSQEWFE